MLAGVPSEIEFSSYHNVDGTLQNTSEPALGGLGAEIVQYRYKGTGQLSSITGSTGYLLETDHSALGQAQQLVLGTANTEAHKKIYVTQTYEEGTGRLTRSHVTSQSHGYMLQDVNYGFDQAGNVTRIADPTTLGGTSSAETQCFTYDGQRRLTEAWTPSSQNCADPRSATALSGPAPYWTGYTYNSGGQRTSETRHTATGDVRTAYCYTGAQPHVLTATSTSTCDQPNRTYAYDASGNTRSRPGDRGQQDLQWSPEGKLAKVTEEGTATDYLYDADSNLLIRATASGERVLYAGATEVHLRADGTVWAQRTYGSGDVTVAVRTNRSGSEKLHYLVADHHGSQSLAIAADTHAFVKRRLTVFGAERGAPTGGAWPTDKGFLGKTGDATTGLTHIGAREYDPGIGQFISVDPVLDPDRPQTMNGYSYAGNNPTTYSDPSGRILMECWTGEIKCVGGKPVTSGSGSSSGSGSGGGSGTSGSATKPTGSSPVSGHYTEGAPQEPRIAYTSSFPYDPGAEPTWEDRLSWMKWQAKKAGAFWCSLINSCDVTGDHDADLGDAQELYHHYIGGTGLDMELDYEKAYAQDGQIRGAVNAEIEEAQRWAEMIQEANGKKSFNMTGQAVNVGGQEQGNYPETENWQKAIGEHKIWGSASVEASGDTFTMRITVHAKDRYDFNKGMNDVKTGIDDAENGRWETLGWAKPFITRGTVTRTVTWTRGDILGSSNMSGGGGR